MEDMDRFIRSLDIISPRDIESEKSWSHEQYKEEVEEALSFHCENAGVSAYFKHQLSQLMHQGYILFGETTFSITVRSIYESMELVAKGSPCRGKLRNVSNAVGSEILHIHTGKSSGITENWVNYARKTKLKEKPFTHETVYNNLISSLSKPNRTGEWVVYTKTGSEIKFLCVWLHNSGDEMLIETINEIFA